MVGWLAKSVSQANTAVQLTTTVIPCISVTIQADKDNLDRIYVGDSNVSSTSDQGLILSVTDGKVFWAQCTITASSAANPINLADIWISSASSTARVNVLYVQQ